MHDDEPSLNIPSLLTLAVVSFFVIRWFFNRDEGPASASRPRGRGNAVDPAQVEQISQMFPQLSTRDIMWDLQRNGGSAAATTERILTGRGLETVRHTYLALWCCYSDSRHHTAHSRLLICLDELYAIFDRNTDRSYLAAPIVPTSGRNPFYQCGHSTGYVKRCHQGGWTGLDISV